MHIVPVGTVTVSATTTAYAGNLATITDPAGKQRQMTYDALGRMTQVTEDPVGLNYVTTYSYDVLNNLGFVTQGSEARSFVYDALGRLTQSSNPDTGPVSFTYDAANNVQTKTDGRGTKTTYSYDVLNRLIGKQYSDGTASEAWGYDVAGVLYGKGRLGWESDGYSVTNYLSYL